MALGTLLSEVPNPSSVLRIPSDLLTTSKSLPKKKRRRIRDRITSSFAKIHRIIITLIMMIIIKVVASVFPLAFLCGFSLFERAVKNRKTHKSSTESLATQAIKVVVISKKMLNLYKKFWLKRAGNEQN